MHHHSEFKCVVGATLSAYGQANANAETQPWSVFSGGGSTAGWTEGGTSVDLGKANACDLTGADYQAAGAASVNPEFPGFACMEADLDTTGTRAQWIVVNYLNAGLDETTPPTPEYRRGCINECVELTVAACDGYDGAPAGFRCDAAYAANFGKIRCGCGMDYSGPHTSCALGCPNTSGQAGHFMSPGLDVYSRAGDGPLYWMCLDPSASAGGTLASGEFRLRGQVPATSTSGTLMHSELPDGGVGYHLTGRARLEVQPFP
jgi:hypothetical protein